MIEVDGDQDAEVKVIDINFCNLLSMYSMIFNLKSGLNERFLMYFPSQVDTVDGGDVKKTEQHVRPCALDENTERLIKFIFNNDMFKEAMTNMNLGGLDIHCATSITNLEKLLKHFAVKTKFYYKTLK